MDEVRGTILVVGEAIEASFQRSEGSRLILVNLTLRICAIVNVIFRILMSGTCGAISPTLLNQLAPDQSHRSI